MLTHALLLPRVCDEDAVSGAHFPVMPSAERQLHIPLGHTGLLPGAGYLGPDPGYLPDA